MPEFFAEPGVSSPEFDVPREMSFEIVNKKIEDKIKATIFFEVVEKDENGITIAIDGIDFRSKNKRKFA